MLRPAALLLVVVAAAGCSSAAAPTRPSTSAAAQVSVTRWWSNDAAAVGSRIDPAHPVTAKLHASREQYCTMLRQTVASGHAILPGASATTRLVATRAFLAELRAVAPPAVAPSWQIVDRTLLALAAAGGNAAKVQGLDTRAVPAAVHTVATDARSACGVDLSR